ncbi:unnamed protein product [Rhizophagus irregularis]|nr:unnamed protein product [Rhizophagus irregularis]
MEFFQNLVKEKPSVKVSLQDVSKVVPKDWSDETVIFTKTERKTTMYRSGDRWCEDSSNLNGGRSMYFLLDKPRTSSEKTRGTNKLSIKTSKTTVRLDNDLGEKSHISSNSINSFLEERPSESKKIAFGASLIEPVHVSTGREWGSVKESRILGLRQLCGDQSVVSVTPVKEGSFNKNTHNFNSNKTTNASMPQLSDDSGLQYEQYEQYEQYDLPELLFSLKDKYSFHDETNKNILYDDEIKRFAKLYCITNFCLVLSCDDSIFWLKDPDGVIYIWSRIDSMMMRAGCDMKEALLNFLFHGENFFYVEDYTLKLIPVIKLKEEANKWYEENKDTITEIVVFDELLKPLEEKKEESNKGGKRKKRQRRKNKH